MLRYRIRWVSGIRSLSPPLRTRAGLAALMILGVVLAGCSRNADLPAVGSDQYRALCSAFYLGLAGLQSGEDVRARDGLERSTKIAPGEPAAWADLGILQVRQQEFDAAFKSVDKARALAPDNSRIEWLAGLIESKRGKEPEAIAHFERAVSLDSKNLKALYSLAEETERQGVPESDSKAEEYFNQILKAQPGNIAVLLDVARLAAKQGHSAQLKNIIGKLRPLSNGWPDAAKAQFEQVQRQADGPNPRAAAVPVVFLRNVLLRTPAYQHSLEQVKIPTTLVAEPFVRFIRLPSPSSEPSPPDIALAFTRRQLPAPVKGSVAWVGAIALDVQSNPAVVWADSKQVHIAGGANVDLPKPLSGAGTLLTKNAIIGADLNYDFKTDLVIATSGGLRIYRQVDRQRFQDVTRQTKLPDAVLNGLYTGAWAFDFDLDGDLDLVLGTQHGEPVVLRNNGDGTFARLQTFKGVDGLLNFAAADIDGDGDPDVAMIDGSGRLRIFTNERLGAYRPRAVPAAFADHNLDVSTADINGDGALDFVVLRDDFSIVRLSDKEDHQSWESAVLARSNSSGPGNPNLVIADLDNNGALDLVVGSEVFLNDGKRFAPLPNRLNGNCQTAVDLNGEGRLDAIGLAAGANGAVEAFDAGSIGTKHYHWQTIRTRAAHATGDQRINSFGIGGVIEVRSDLLTQKQIINSPVLHFGLGDHTNVDFARIVWPNGLVQAEFSLKPDTTVLAEQRLKGSCPFLFTWDGHGIRFVKDTAPWSPALGLHINAQQVAGIYQTQEWFKIPGDDLIAHDGYYDLRVTAEYWETYYIDHYSLLVVDHPQGTQVYADERFAVPPPPLKLYLTKDPKPFARATDDNGNDVSAMVAAIDKSYLDTFGRGQYQGVTRDHFIELQLPADAPENGPLYLIGDGWMHPTDATTNVALGQNCAPPPQGLSIEVPDRDGRWMVARRGLGFPAGRFKTVVLDLSGIFQPGTPRKLRLRTNLEIYWDRLAWAAGVPDTEMKTTHLQLAAADLRYRGFSKMTQANLSSPEIPDYNVLAGTGQRWRDLQGYCTRYGDVRELLAKIDDRIAITNAGDELRLKFAEQAPVRDGWVRDYVMVGDGWIKDGDYNSTFSKTVLPLPYHGMKDYNIPPTVLEDDPAYRLHPTDWEIYHTRYVTPGYFVNELWKH